MRVENNTIKVGNQVCERGPVMCSEEEKLGKKVDRKQNAVPITSKVAGIWHVKYRRIRLVCSSPRFRTLIGVNRQYAKPIRLGDFITRPRWSLGTKFELQIAAIGVENCKVCPHQSTAKLVRKFSWGSNSPRSTYKIAWCVAGFR